METKARLSLFQSRISLYACLFLFMTLTDCGGFNVVSSRTSGSVPNFILTGGGSLVPPTDKVDPNCLSQTVYDACIFNKNPVAQKQSAIGTDADLAAQQIYGVKLTGLSPTGLLENNSIHIKVANGQPLSTFQLNYRLALLQDDSRQTLQLMTYYWLERSIEFIQAETAALSAINQNINVAVDDTVAGWSPSTNTIHLTVDDTGLPMGLSGEITVYFFGQANLYYAMLANANSGVTAGQFANSTATHVACGGDPSGCCTSKDGCLRALSSGTGEYFVAIMFPQAPSLGDYLANQTSGLTLCGINRNPLSNTALTSDKAYSACTSSGDVHVMGSLYASIWAQIRAQAEATAPGTGSKAIDTLFLMHQNLFTTTETILTSRDKALSVDQSKFGGKYSALIRAQFLQSGY